MWNLSLLNMEKRIFNYISWGFLIVIALAVLFFYPRYVFAPNVILEDIEIGARVEDASGANWIDVELKDVLTGDVFRLSDFDKPIILESFAVWCPTCKRQQDEIQGLIDSGDDSIHVSMNTDPNEDENKVIEHVNRYGYTWPFVVFPKDATKTLIEEFGNGVVNAPGAPILLICPNGESRLLKSGVKSAGELKEEIATC